MVGEFVGFSVKVYEVVKCFFFGKTISDRQFKIATNYGAVLFLVLMGMTMKASLNCKGTDMRMIETHDINSYCMNNEIFLVEKALLPNYTKRIKFPGVTPYDRERESKIKLTFYNRATQTYYVMIGIAYCINFFWQVCVINIS